MIRKVLVANRGEIAIRIFQTLREMGIRTVAVFTDPDAHALHVRSAHEVRRVESYLDAAEIIRAATESGADAIHPGYGFLSESASLSSACDASEITFIGPRTDTIAEGRSTRGSKLGRQSPGIRIPRPRQGCRWRRRKRDATRRGSVSTCRGHGCGVERSRKGIQ